MRKMGLLLNDVTILNFPFIWKLMRRYYLITIFMPILAFSIGIYLYYSQHDIYMTSIGLKNEAGLDNSPTKAIASLLGESNVSLTSSEIVALGQSLDLQQQLAEILVAHPDFEKLNLSAPGKDFVSLHVLLDSCGDDRECIIAKVRGCLTGLYAIVQNDDIRTQYILTVKAQDAFSAELILKELIALVQQERVRSIKYFLTEQIKISEELITQKQDELKFVNMDDLQLKAKTLDLKLEEINFTLRHLGGLFSGLKQKLSHSESAWQQTQNTLNNQMSPEDVADAKKVVELRSEIKKLHKEISIIDVSGATGTDALILQQLKEDLKQKQNELSSFENTTGTYVPEEFLENRDKEAIRERYDHKVMTGEYERVKREYQQLFQNKKALIEEKFANDKQLEELRPSFEYLDLLNAKKTKLRLLESTVISDLIFDKYHTPLKRFKRSSLVKIFIFAFLISTFLMFIGLILRYRFDDRIYDEDELAQNFSELPFIGTTPEFN